MKHPLLSLASVVALSLTLPLITSEGWAQPVPAPGPADAARTAAAQQRFDRGRALYERRDFAQAVIEFRGALELYPSPNTRLYVGLCLLELNQLAEAHTELQRTYSEARDRANTDPRYVAARDISERHVNALRPRLGRLVISANQRPEGAVLRVGSTEILAPMLGLELLFDPGDVTVTASAPGFLEFRQSVRLVADASTEVRVTFERAPVSAPTTPALPTVTDPRGVSSPIVTTASRQPNTPMRDASTITVSETTGGGVRVGGYVVGALGLAGVATFAVLGNLAKTQFEQVRAECRGRCVESSYLPMIEEGERNELLANISLGVGLGLTLTGAIMIAVGGPRAVDESGDSRRTAVRPFFNLAQRTLGVTGAF